MSIFKQLERKFWAVLQQGRPSSLVVFNNLQQRLAEEGEIPDPSDLIE